MIMVVSKTRQCVTLGLVTVEALIELVSTATLPKLVPKTLAVSPLFSRGVGGCT